MTHSPAVSAPVTNELTVMQDMLSMDSLNHILELGCGNARLAQELLTRYPIAATSGWKSTSASMPST